MNQLSWSDTYKKEKNILRSNVIPTITIDKQTDEYRVIRQLLEALFYEKIIPFSWRKNILTFSINNEKYTILANISGFDRIQIDLSTLRNKQRNSLARLNISSIIDHLSCTVEAKTQLKKELQQTIRLCEWNTKHVFQHANRRSLNYHLLESAIHEGHPYHPCYKSRTGFSIQDHELYGPENGQTFQLIWLAIRLPLIKFNIPQNEIGKFWKKELGEKIWIELNEKAHDRRVSLNHFCLMPVHPWQWKTIKHKLNLAIKNSDLIVLGAAGDSYQASISVRTLLNTTAPQKAHIKLPLNMVNTSSLRTLEPHSVCTAPELSKWLNEIIDIDPFFKKTDSFHILSEYAGIRLKNDIETNTLNKPWLNMLQGQLSVIYREGLALYHDEEKCVPFVALSLIESDRKPFIHLWIEKYGCKQWLTQLLDVVVTPIWHLLVHHGVALETHAQNMILEHDDGWPKRIILRDFHESLEYVEDYIADHSLIPDFANMETCYKQAKPNQYYWMKNTDNLRELFVDTLFIYNLSDIAVLMQKKYDFKEQDFWIAVKECLLRYEKNGHTNKQRLSRINLFQDQVNVESLITKKIYDKPLEFSHKVKNALCDTYKI